MLHNCFLQGKEDRLVLDAGIRPEWLATAVARFLRRHPEARFLLAGEGPAGEEIRQILDSAGVVDRLHSTGVLGRHELAGAYQAMDVFVFAALTWFADLPPEGRRQLQEGALQTAGRFSMTHTATRALDLYQALIDADPLLEQREAGKWRLTRQRIAEEWKILRNISHAVGDAVRSPPDGDAG